MKQTVSWATPITEVRRSKAVTTYPTTCKCGYRRNLRRPAALHAEKTGACRRCSNAAKAPLGFRAMARKYGFCWAMNHVHATQETKISRPEQLMMRLLDKLGIHYQRNILIKTKTRGRKRWACQLDFYVWMNGVQVALEIDGEYVHAINPRHVKNDIRKARLFKRRGIPLLRITDQEIKRGEAESKLNNFGANLVSLSA